MKFGLRIPKIQRIMRIMQTGLSKKIAGFPSEIKSERCNPFFSKRTKNKRKNDGRVVQPKFADKITRNAKNHHYYNISVDFSESY